VLPVIETEEVDMAQETKASRMNIAPSPELRSGAIAAASVLAIVMMSYFCTRELSGSAPVVSLFAPSVGAASWWTLAVAIAATCLRAVHRLGRSSGQERQLGQYTLDEKIGEGGMGVVYKAHHALLRRPVAIKLLPPERAGEQNLKRFEREGQLTSMLTHPNTITIYDFGRTAEGTFYYAMEYLDGLDLQTLVERDGPQDPARVAHLLAQLAGALHEAHQVGLIHRDVKPANVMVCERGGMVDVVKVLDFGLIKEIDSRGDVALTDVHRIVGTPLYLAPEALTAPERIDARSDLYAVGAVGYFLLTGAPPFSGKSLMEVCGHHLHTVPVPPSERRGVPIPQELETLILSCLAKSPGERPASAAALQTALLAFAAEWTQERAAQWWAERGAKAPASLTLETTTECIEPPVVMPTALAA
jgi:serine/threonine-protein kinase